MFEFKDLAEHFGNKMIINNEEYTLTNIGEIAMWISNSYKVYATPYFEDIPVPVEVIAINEQPIGTDSYPVEVYDFERYTKVVKTLSEKILRRARMQ